MEKNNDNIHKWIIIYIFLVKLMVFYKFNIHTWINQHQKKTCGPLGQVIWSFYLAKTLVDISNQTQGLYYNIVHNVSTAIGSTTNKFAINGRRKPSTYGWFIFALLTLHILNVHVILLFPCRNVFFQHVAWRFWRCKRDPTMAVAWSTIGYTQLISRPVKSLGTSSTSWVLWCIHRQVWTRSLSHTFIL